MFNAVFIIRSASPKILCLGVMNAVFIIRSASPKLLCLGVMNAVFIIRSASPKLLCLGVRKYNCNSVILSFIAVIRHPV